MLSSSAIAFGYDFNLAAIGNPSIPTGIPGGTELLGFVDAVFEAGNPGVGTAQSAVIDALGSESLVDAAGVLGNFEMMNRVAEGTGIPLPAQTIDRMRYEIDALGLGDFLKS